MGASTYNLLPAKLYIYHIISKYFGIKSANANKYPILPVFSEVLQTNNPEFH